MRTYCSSVFVSRLISNASSPTPLGTFPLSLPSFQVSYKFYFSSCFIHLLNSVRFIFVDLCLANRSSINFIKWACPIGLVILMAGNKFHVNIWQISFFKRKTWICIQEWKGEESHWEEIVTGYKIIMKSLLRVKKKVCKAPLWNKCYKVQVGGKRNIQIIYIYMCVCVCVCV